MPKPYFDRYENMNTHWLNCRTCGGNSWDSDTTALAGKSDLSEADVTHDKYCPGKEFPLKYVRRIERIY